MESVCAIQSFLFAYINTTCWIRFGIFTAFYTGNMCHTIVAGLEGNWRESAFRLALCVCHGFVGVNGSQFVKERVSDKTLYLAIL